ncbi:hypothetical protein [Frankia sp. AgB1.9]|uniref:hypothetical protein n=1 Tax=Frankia sp. AgB1.9 TaxID=1836968 RepID=UPI001EE4D828|nr:MULTISPECIES: hypothetical protein [unclassified Frankia]
MSGILMSLFAFVCLRVIFQRAISWTEAFYLIVIPINLVVMARADRRVDRLVTSELRGGQGSRRPEGDESYVLYLRPFTVDGSLAAADDVGGRNFLTTLADYFGYRHPGELTSTWESRLIGLLQRFGQVFAVGRPGESLPLPGARRFYLRPGEPWHDDVSELISGARLVVIVASIAPDSMGADGTLWEYTESIRLLSPSRVLLVAVGERAGYERFRADAARYYRTRAEELSETGEELPPPPALPAWPAPRRPARMRTGVFPMRGVIRFADGWAPEFVHFDTSAERGLTPHARWRRTAARQVKSFIEEFEKDLPGTVFSGIEARWHWQSKVLVTTFMALAVVFLLKLWDGRSIAERLTVLAALALVALPALARLTRLIHDGTSSFPKVRMPDEEPDSVSAETPGSGGARYIVLESTLRWPGRFGIGLQKVRSYSDENGRPVLPPTRSPLWPMTTRKTLLLPPQAEPIGLGRNVLCYQVVRYVQTERDAKLRSGSFLVRAIFSLIIAIGAFVGAIIMFSNVPGIDFSLLFPLLLLLASGRFLLSCGRDCRRLGAITLTPRIPQDITREPNALYLHPRPAATDPTTPWESGLLRDLIAAAGGKFLLRGTAMNSDLSPSRAARLPLLGDDWRSTLSTALPHFRFVIVPACGLGVEARWQVTEAARLLPPSRLLIVLRSGDEAAAEYVRLRQSIQQAFDERAAEISEFDRAGSCLARLPVVPLAAAAPDGWHAALQGVIYFTDDGTPQVLRFDLVDTDDGEDGRKPQILRIRETLRPIFADPAPSADGSPRTASNPA